MTSPHGAESAPFEAQLVGSALVSVELLDWTWSFGFDGDASILTEAHWRSFHEGRVTTSSEDHGQWFGLPAPVDAAAAMRTVLAGRTVVSASVRRESGDLVLDFGEGVELQFLQLSSGYESWRVHVGGVDWICTGGGELVRHQPD